MLIRQQLLAEYKSKHSKIMKGFRDEYAILDPRAGAPIPEAADSHESDLSMSGVPVSGGRFEETRATEGSHDLGACTAADAGSERAASEAGGHQQKIAASEPGSAAECAPLGPGHVARPAAPAALSGDAVQHGPHGQKRREAGREDSAAEDQHAGNGGFLAGSTPKSTRKRSSASGARGRTPLGGASGGAGVGVAEPCTAQPDDRCTDDETVIAEETRIQDQSCFMGDQAHTIDALNQYRKRRARRRTGRRVQKRAHAPHPELPEAVKRRKTEQAKSFLIEYYQELQKSQKQAGSAAVSSGAEKESRARWKKKVKRARSQALELKSEMERELAAVRKMKEELLGMEELKRAEHEALHARLANEAAELKRLRDEREEDMKKLAECQRLIDSGAHGKPARAGHPSKPSLERGAPEAGAAALESKIFIEKQMAAGPTDINSFFAVARRKHIEKTNQTLLSRTMLNDASETAKQKVTFNNVPHKPRQPVLKMAAIRPQDLYKQTIDAQKADGSPKDYVPETDVPVYASEDEFEMKEKRFEPAPFTMDPRLQHLVRKQSHNEIRRFFGAQLDIDVETIFSHVENVTNFSPNKLVRRGRHA